MSSRRILHHAGAFALSGAALLIGSCGGDGEGNRSTSTPPPTATGRLTVSATARPTAAATFTPESVRPAASPTVFATTPEPTGIAETPTEPPGRTDATATPAAMSWQDGGKWHYTPAGSTCVYNETTRTQGLYRSFTNADVILMDSENCTGTWYVFYPSTGEAVGGLSDPDDPRLRLRLVGGKVTVIAGKDGCTWMESRRQSDGQGATIVVLDTTCGKYQYSIWYVAETGELQYVIA